METKTLDNIGKIFITTRVDEEMKQNEKFKFFVYTSLGRYTNCDWGNTNEDDAKQNNIALETGERVLAVYERQLEPKKIWILTEADRSATTILFPDEY